MIAIRIVLAAAAAALGVAALAPAADEVGGIRRGYFEVQSCPRGGSPIHADFTFNQGRHASADDKVRC